MKRFAILLLAAGVVASCTGQLSPYAVAPDPRIANKIAADKTASAIGICHSDSADPAEVLAEAQYQCRDGQVSKASEEHFWTPCALTQPYRTTFICQK